MPNFSNESKPKKRDLAKDTGRYQKWKGRFPAGCRINGRGERKYFAAKDEADGDSSATGRAQERGNLGHGMSRGTPRGGVNCQRRLDPCNASLTDAVEFYLKSRKATRRTPHDQGTR